MGNGIAYPSIEQIEAYNMLSLMVIKAKKADAHATLSRSKIRDAISECESAEGDIYCKAAVLIRALVKKHAFASGNRRTAFITAKSFIIANNGEFRIPDDPHCARAMQGIREDYYSDEEIMEWIKNGKIREFKRR